MTNEQTHALNKKIDKLQSEALWGIEKASNTDNLPDKVVLLAAALKVSQGAADRLWHSGKKASGNRQDLLTIAIAKRINVATAAFGNN